MQIPILYLLTIPVLFSVCGASTPPTASVSASPASLNPTSPTSSFSTQITKAPEILSGDLSVQLQEKYHQTTYWSCVTLATQVHCGWHEPILNGGDEIPDGGASLRISMRGAVGAFLGAVGLMIW